MSFKGEILCKQKGINRSDKKIDQNYSNRLKENEW